MIAILLSVFVSAPVVIENVKVEVGDGTAHEKVNVVIDNGRIVSIGGTQAPANATRIDGKDKVLAPGFVETVSQLGLTEVGMEDSTNDYVYQVGPIVPGFRAADGFNAKSPRFAISREEGITSAITSPRGKILYGTGVWIDLVGTTRPDVNKPIAMFGGIGTSAARGAGDARGGLWLALRELVDDTRFYMKNSAAFDRGEARALSVSPLHLRAFAPVLEGKLPLVLDADRESDIRAALSFAKENNIKLFISGGAEAWRVAKDLSAAKVPVILRPSIQQAYSYDSLLARDDNATLLHDAGVPVIISSGDGDQNIRRIRQEAGVAVAHGLPHNEAVRSITSRPAAFFGQSDVGVIAPGKRANLVLWSGDVLELSSVAERVFIDGVELPRDNRQRKLVERYLK